LQAGVGRAGREVLRHKGLQETADTFCEAGRLVAKFLKKTLVALAALPLLLVALYQGGWWLLLPLIVMALIGMGEYYAATRHKGHRPAVMLGFITGIMVLGVTQFAPPELREGSLLGIIIVLVGGTLVAQFGNRPGQSAVNNSAITAFGVIYLPLMLSFLLRLRQIDLPQAFPHPEMVWDFFHRAGAVLIVIVPVWLSDTVAMGVGSVWGRHKLAPSISPGKTVEGTAAGFIACTIGAVAIGAWIGMPWYHAAILGVFEGVVGPLGDLGKSALKRDLGIKDFGQSFGAHGGVLDRFDSVMSCMPPVYLYLWLFFLH
jgi:phosphatidate cytidylyltransferase